MPFILFLMLIGAGAGFVLATYARLRVPKHVAVLAGAFGGLIGGMALKMLLSFFGALIGALLGALMVVFIAQAVTRR